MNFTKKTNPVNGLKYYICILIKLNFYISGKTKTSEKNDKVFQSEHKICHPCGTYFLLSCKSRLARFGVTPRLLAMQSLLFLVSFHLMQLQTSLLLRSSFRHSLAWPHLCSTMKQIKWYNLDGWVCGWQCKQAFCSIVVSAIG